MRKDFDQLYQFDMVIADNLILINCHTISGYQIDSILVSASDMNDPMMTSFNDAYLRPPASMS